MGDEFAIDIPVTLDLASARAGLRQFLEEAAKGGVNVPLRSSVGAGAGGGQGAPVSPRVSAAEQAAVNRAMEQVQRTPPGYYGGALSGAMGGGAGNIRAGVGTGDVEIGFRRVRGIFDEVKRHIESNPIRITVDSTGVQAALAQARAGAGVAGGVGAAGAAAAVAQQIGMTPAATQALVQQAAGAAAVPVAGTPQAIANMRQQLFGNAQAQLAAIQAAALPGSPLLAVAGAGAARQRGGPGYAYGIPRSASGTPLGEIRYARAIGGALGVTEISNAVQVYRSAESNALRADTPEEAELIRARGRDQRFAGLFGSIITAIPNVLNTPGNPQQELRNAEEAADYRKMRDETRMRNYGITESAMYRSRYESRGPAAAQIAGIRQKYVAKGNELLIAIERDERKLTEQTPVVDRYMGGYMGQGATKFKTGGEDVYQGTARDSIREQLETNKRQLNEQQDQEKFEVAQLQRERKNMLSTIARRGRELDLGIEGSPGLAREREFVNRLRNEEDKVSNDPALLAAQKGISLKSVEARKAEILRERFETGDRLDQEMRQSRFRKIGTSESGVAATIDRIVSETHRDVRQYKIDSDPVNAVKRNTLGVQQLREARSQLLGSISYDSFSPNAIVGKGSLSDLGREFFKAEDRIGGGKEFGDKKDVYGKDAKSEGKSETLLGEIRDILRIISERDPAAIAG